jgi:hypothetical protein
MQVAQWFLFDALKAVIGFVSGLCFYVDYAPY